MDISKDQGLIDAFHKRSGHSPATVKTYRSVFNKYREFHNMGLCELFEEAISEQEQQLPINRLSIYDRILSFRDYLTENFNGSTPYSLESKIKTFYRYNRVEIPFIPPLNGMDLVDLIQGRGKNKTREAYYKDNPENLKLEYIKVMSNVSLYRRYEYKIVNDKMKVISMPL